MQRLQLHVSGAGDTRRAAESLKAVLGDEIGIVVEPAPIASADARRAIDPIAAAALILSIPSALLAVADLVQRIRSRKKASELIEVGGRLTVEHRVEIHVMTPTGPQALRSLTPDRLLDLANTQGPAP